MEILEEVKRHLAAVGAVGSFLDRAALKARTLRQGEYTFAGIR